ncbi:MAG: hypothetical protein ACYC6Y_22450, partial [Thermoguttaceae bacterium]
MPRFTVVALLGCLLVAGTGATVGAADTPAAPPGAGNGAGVELQSRQAEPPAYSPGDSAESISREPVALRWKLQPGDRLYQEVLVTQKSACQVQGIEIATGLKYVILSRIGVEEVASDGTVVVLQKVEATRLLEADPMARSAFGDLLTRLAGKTFRLTLNSRMEIVAMEADDDAFAIVA